MCRFLKKEVRPCLLIAPKLQNMPISFSLEHKNVTLNGKRNFTDMSKLRILRWGRLLLRRGDYLGGLSVITSIFVRGK